MGRKAALLRRPITVKMETGSIDRSIQPAASGPTTYPALRASENHPKPFAAPRAGQLGHVGKRNRAVYRRGRTVNDAHGE